MSIEVCLWHPTKLSATAGNFEVVLIREDQGIRIAYQTQGATPDQIERLVRVATRNWENWKASRPFGFPFRVNL
jgi:hypothetical protein